MSSPPEIDLNLNLSLNLPATQNPDQGANLDLDLNLPGRNLDLDLNSPVIPPNEGPSSSNNLPSSQAIPVTQGPVPQMATINIDSPSSSSDDVILSSPRSIAEARNNARRRRGGITIGVDAEKQAAPQSPPKQPTIQCSICLDAIVEETTTNCGHVFCKVCIRTAVKKKKKCPSCRKKLGLRDLQRIFLSNNNI